MSDDNELQIGDIIIYTNKINEDSPDYRYLLLKKYIRKSFDGGDEEWMKLYCVDLDEWDEVLIDTNRWKKVC